jgi:hypothetical protein
MLKRNRLGDDAQAYCGRCKEERLHQVVALHSDNRIEQVTCNYCRTSHRYRDPEAKTATKARTATGSRAAATAANKNIPTSDRPARAYSPRETYAAGEVVAHPTFGQGTVVEARQGKIDVRFGKEMRTLLHAS